MNYWVELLNCWIMTTKHHSAKFLLSQHPNSLSNKPQAQVVFSICGLRLIFIWICMAHLYIYTQTYFDSDNLIDSITTKFYEEA